MIAIAPANVAILESTGEIYAHVRGSFGPVRGATVAIIQRPLTQLVDRRRLATE
jgi:hypothetical protein